MSFRNEFQTRDLHWNGDDRNPADSAGSAGNPAGMEGNVAGVPQEWKYNLAGLPREYLFILPYNVLL